MKIKKKDIIDSKDKSPLSDKIKQDKKDDTKKKWKRRDRNVKYKNG